MVNSKGHGDGGVDLMDEWGFTVLDESWELGMGLGTSRLVRRFCTGDEKRQICALRSNEYVC